MNKETRRTFLKTMGTGLTAAAAAATSRTAPAAASDRVQLAVIGTGSRGGGHVKDFDSFSDCDVVAVCDVDPERRNKAKGRLRNPSAAKEYSDFRKLLDDASIDAVCIATPDHWHTPVALHALQAGKHVYVEKPCCHNVHEGQVLARAAEKYGKCVQHGTQARSDAGLREGIDFLLSGELGKIRLAKAINHQRRGPIGRAKVEDPPAGVDYDLWLGPAPKRPFTQNRWHYNWHWFWDYGCGDMANDGIHQIDQALWGLGVGMPNAVQGSGAQLWYDDDHETPDTQMITFEYDDCYLVYEMRLWTDYKLEGHDNGVIFYGDKGTLEMGSDGCHVTLLGEERRHLAERAGSMPHLKNFLTAVKADDPAALQAPIGEGAISSALCHMGNIVTRVKRGVQVDTETWRFKDDDEANALLKREYRKGYELPEIG